MYSCLVADEILEACDDLVYHFSLYHWQGDLEIWLINVMEYFTVLSGHLLKHNLIQTRFFFLILKNKLYNRDVPSYAFYCRNQTYDIFAMHIKFSFVNN